MLADKAQELDALRERRTKLRAELEQIHLDIATVSIELAQELRQDHPLTEREAQILALVRTGKQNKEIGEILNISERTVKFHVSALLAKAMVHKRHDL